MQSLRFDPFRDFDRLAAEVFGTARTPSLMPMDCLRTGEQFVCRFDLPGIDAESLDVSAENQTLTVRAERTRRDPEGSVYVVSERPSGSYSRQLVLGDGLAGDQFVALVGTDRGVATPTDLDLAGLGLLGDRDG